jgi:hypothetical protein
VNKHLPAYAVLEGPFNFNRTPLAPPGTKAIIYNDPSSRTSWGPHGEDAYYVNRVPEHWRCYKFFVPDTKAFRISGAAKFFPTHCKMPAVDPGDTVRLAAQDLITALNNLNPNAPIDLEPRHSQALRDLSNIFQQSIKQTSEGEGESPRVATEPSTSHNTTAPRVVQLAPRIHQRTTRRNTPILPTIQEETTPAPRTNKISQKHDARMAQRQARAQRREEEEKAIKQAIKDNIQNIKDVRLRKISEEQDRVIIEPVRAHTTDEKNNNDINRPIPITQECDSVIGEGPKKLSTNKKSCGLRNVTPKRFARDVLYHTIANHVENYSSVFVPKGMEEEIGSINMQVPIEECMGAGVVNPKTGETLTKYEQLLKVSALQKIWSGAMCIELGRLATGWEGEQGTETIEFMSIDKIKAIPKDRTVTYARIVVDYRPQKKDPNRVRITVGGNLIDYPGELTTRTADLITSKILWNSTLSTPGARYMCADVKNFYLCTPMDGPEYMKMKADLFPEEFMDKYKLHGYIWIHIV